jgi:hypothetical protein
MQLGLVKVTTRVIVTELAPKLTDGTEGVAVRPALPMLMFTLLEELKLYAG